MFSCAPATLSGGSRAPAAGQEGGGATVVAISADRIHERVIAEAPPGSEIVSWRVTGAGDALHVAWMDKSKTVWMDGKPAAGPYDEVKYLAFRGEYATLMLVARRKSAWVLRTGSQEYGGFTKVTVPGIGPDGKVAAGVCREKACRLLVDGQETGPAFDDISAPTFSRNGTHLVYFGQRNKRWATLLDGRETAPEMDDWSRHRWSPDEAQLAIAAEVGGKYTWVVNGTAGPPFDVIGEIAFSRDGRHYAFGGADAGAGFTKKEVRGAIVVDGQRQEPGYAGRGLLGNWTWLGGRGQAISKGVRSLSADFHGVSDPDFLANGDLVFGHRLPDGGIAVSVGGREGQQFDDLLSSILVSADGVHVVYVAQKDAAFVEVHDQTPGHTFPANRDIAMVPWIGMSGGHLSYATALGGPNFKSGHSDRAVRRVILDGMAEAAFDAKGISHCLFSEDGEQHAYIVLGAEGERDRLVLNGEQTGLYDDIGRIDFLPSGVEFVARQGRRLLAVRVERR